MNGNQTATAYGGAETKANRASEERAPEAEEEQRSLGEPSDEAARQSERLDDSSGDFKLIAALGIAFGNGSPALR